MKKHTLLFFIFVLALMAMLGSLYYSNFGDIWANIQSGDLFNTENGLAPCHLCWWARIWMYPMVPLSFMALQTKNYKIVTAFFPFLGAGIALESYHYALQKFDIATSEMCTFANPCNALKVDYFGWLTIPMQCLIAFMLIFMLSVRLHKKSGGKIWEVILGLGLGLAWFGLFSMMT